MYEDDLKINKFDLDNEWNDQPYKYMKYIKEAVKAETEAKRAKNNLDYTKAKLYIEIREEREENKEKVTESIMDNLVLINQEYRDVQEEYLEKLEESKLLNGAVEAFSQRKSGLENIVKLFLNKYYSHPKEEDEKNSIVKKQKETMSKKLTKNKRRKSNG